MPRKKFDHTGLIYNRLTVIKEVPSKNTNPNWLCQCSCGNLITTTSSNLKNKNTTSCGCFKKDIVTKHGDVYTRLYAIHQSMLQRCNNSKNTNYKHYGDRGITVCDTWMDYNNFKEWALLNGYTDILTIDRIDVNKGYYPENCRWADHTIQARNKNINPKNTTGYFGVYFSKSINKYTAQICIEGKSTHLGVSDNPIELAKFRDNYIISNKLHGFPLNFPI
jgi:hypothetical protein